MKKMLIMTALLTIALVSPALAGHDRGEHRGKNYRVEKKHPTNYARHDRGEKYDKFQKRMHKLRKELRHERKENRRLERRDARRHHRAVERRATRREYRREWRHDRHRPRPIVVAPRPHRRPVIFPRIVLNIPLNW